MGKTSPVPVSIFNSKQIEKSYHAQDVPYLLSSVPSLVESSDAGAGVGYTSMRIRGSDPTRINVSINGIPLNDAESQGVFWVNLPDLAASAAEIQVQRGVGSSTNGAGAFGATVNVDISKIAPEAFGILSNSVGSFGTRKHALQFGSGLLNKRFSISGRASKIVSDGFVDRASADLESLHLSGAYIDDKQSLQAHFLHGKERTYQAWYGLPAQYLNLPERRTYNVAGTEREGLPHPDEVDNYTQRHLLLHYKRLIVNDLTLQLNGHYTRGFGYYEQYKAKQPYADYGLTNPLIDTFPFPDDLIRRRWLDNHFYGGTFALRWSPKRAMQPVALLGGALSQYQGKHFGEVTWTRLPMQDVPGHRYYENDAHKRDANVFLQLEGKILPRLTAMIDLQMRGVQYQFLGFDAAQNQVAQNANLLFFNPKAGLNWQINKQLAWNGYAGVAHREPNRDDYTQSTPKSRPKAERLLDFESSLIFRKSGWQVSANCFHMAYRDQLVLDGRINDVGAYIRTNVPNSYRRGIELEGQWQISDKAILRSNAAISQNKVKRMEAFVDDWDTGGQYVAVFQHSDLAFSPSFTTRSEAAYHWFKNAKHDIASTLIFKHVGPQYIDNSSASASRLPAWQVFDVRVNYDVNWRSKSCSLLFTVANLLDRQYVANGWVYRYLSANYDARPDNPYTRLEKGALYNQTGYFPQAGRNIMATAIIRF